MSDVNNLPNKINDDSNGMGRSNSTVRFQIEKVFDDDTNSNQTLDKTSSIPTSKLNNIYTYI